MVPFPPCYFDIMIISQVIAAVFSLYELAIEDTFVFTICLECFEPLLLFFKIPYVPFITSLDFSDLFNICGAIHVF